MLANLINDVPSNKGWWFRMPKLNTSGKNSAIHPTDVCLPHLGVPFGISEDCMATILTEMECLRITKKDGMTLFVQGGWELLRDKFKVAGTNLLMTPRGQVTAELTAKFRIWIELAQLKWNELNFSLTSKWHVLLNHAADQLEQMDGFADMGEDSIERNHQSREKNCHRNSHLRDKQRRQRTRKQATRISETWM
jgi:hypothetical protein